jgi:hydrogenase maturation protease
LAIPATTGQRQEKAGIPSGRESWDSSSPGSVTLVLGLGNPLLGDDGVGWKLVSQLQKQKCNRAVEFDCLDCSGLALMERLVGYERAILVDAVTTPGGKCGQVLCLPIDQMEDPSLGHLTSAHDTSLHSALELAKQLGLPLPSTILLVGVEIQPGWDCCEELSGPVQQAVPEALQLLQGLLAS